jgi:hypothetical protein
MGWAGIVLLSMALWLGLGAAPVAAMSSVAGTPHAAARGRGVGHEGVFLRGGVSQNQMVVEQADPRDRATRNRALAGLVATT